MLEGNLKILEQDYEGAETAFKRVVQLSPEYVPVHVRLGVLYNFQKRPEDAQKAFQKALELNPNQTDALALLVGTTWLIRHRRPVWYTLWPAAFMLCTSVTMMVWLLLNKYIPGWPKTAPLAVADILILMLTVGILVLTVRRWIVGPETKREGTADFAD